MSLNNRANAMACVRTYAAFRIFSRTRSAGDLSDLIGTQPTKTVERNPHSERATEREYSIWVLSTQGRLDSTDEHEHIDWLLHRISGRAPLFARLRREGCSMDVFCYFEIAHQGGPSLTSHQMGVLSELGLDITWDIYAS